MMTRTATGRLVAPLMMIALFGAACGDKGGSDAPSVTEAESATTAPDSADTTAPAGEPPQGGDEDAPTGDIVLEGGSATITIGDQTTDLDFFFCAFGYEATEDDDISFIGVGEGTDASGAPVQLNVQIYDSRNQDSIRDGLKSVLFANLDDAGSFASGWQYSTSEQLDDLTGVETFVLEGDRVTVNGKFERFVGNDGDTGELADGTVNATCSPNSLGTSG